MQKICLLLKVYVTLPSLDLQFFIKAPHISRNQPNCHLYLSSCLLIFFLRTHFLQLQKLLFTPPLASPYLLELYSDMSKRSTVCAPKSPLSGSNGTCSVRRVLVAQEKLYIILVLESHGAHQHIKVSDKVLTKAFYIKLFIPPFSQLTDYKIFETQSKNY